MVEVEVDYLARARALTPLIGEAAPQIEAGRQLTDEVVSALHEAGLFRLFLPRWLDGGEVAPSVFVEVIETIARADASTAWCLCQMNVCSIASVYLTQATARQIFGEPGSALAWGSTPNAKAVAVPGGYRVSGEWEFGSGCHHATWLGGHCPVVEEDGSPRLDAHGQPLERTLLFPKSSANIADVWNVLGLRGTGSDMYTLDELFVPDDHAILALLQWPDAARLKLAAPYRFGASSLYAAGFASVGLGNARGTLDTFLDLAQRKTPRWGRNPLSEDATVQIAVAKADTELESSRVYLTQTLRENEAAAMRHGGLTLDQRMKIRAAGTFAIRVATGVVDHLYEMAGTTSIFAGNPFERRFRDAHTVSQHLQGRVSHFETVGKHLLGIESEARFV
jgi:alkylation response protein AidB-like acyl-CoA dehydrogenase